jgi:hypothetical protein
MSLCILYVNQYKCYLKIDYGELNIYIVSPKLTINFFLIWQYWCLNSGPYAYEAGTLLLEPHLQAPKFSLKEKNEKSIAERTHKYCLINLKEK